MADREKIITKILDLRSLFTVNPEIGKGIIVDDCRAAVEWLDGVLTLLKVQEPVEPTLDIRHGKSMWRCGSCSTALQPNQMHAKFCFNCGQEVKWK